MKTVLAHEYKIKKRIADNLQNAINDRYINISDSEYERINNAMLSYSNSISEIYDELQDVAFTEPQKSKLLEDIEKLEADILALKRNTLYTQEDGLYFTDENGNIGAKLDANGFQAINISMNGESSGGAQGPQGATGAQGPQGVQGPQGNQSTSSESNLTIIDY